MDSKSVLKPKAPQKTYVRSEQRLLLSRTQAAERLSISPRAIDYLIANKSLPFRRIGTRVLIPAADLERFARADHPQKLAS
jgi:excisionase family DNA binding protein